jgi:RNA polymerase sigma-54 factor
MNMDLGFGQYMQMRPSPSLIQFTEILAMTGLELQDVIHQEVAQNPALDLAETDLCPACGDPLLPNGTCYRCSRGEDLAREAQRATAEPDEETFDVLSRIADQRSLAEHLLVELATVLDEGDLPIAEMLIGELDDRGFLETPLPEIAEALGVDLERVERVLMALQSIGPSGLGARSVTECLLLQLGRWDEIGGAHPLARTLIAEHLDALALGKYGQLASDLGTTHEEIIAARDFIRAHLRPYPVAERIDLAPWERETGPGFVAPDVVVRMADDDTIEVEVVESRRYTLSVTPMYRALLARVESGDATVTRELSRVDRRHVRDQVHRAESFLSHVRERRETMRRVAAYVMARQTGYLRHGPRFLVHLTRAEVAEALDLHESTVSRATSGKYVLLPNRQVVPFGNFFRAALSVQDVLREIVDAESRPLSDSELADELDRRGYRVARRTVAKYRTQMGILPSSLR